MALPGLLKGLSWGRVSWTAALSALVAAASVRFFINTYLDLLISSLCVGFSIMLLVTLAGNARIRRLPREALNATRMAAGVPPIASGTPFASAIVGRAGPKTTPRALSSALRFGGSGSWRIQRLRFCGVISSASAARP